MRILQPLQGCFRLLREPGVRFATPGYPLKSLRDRGGTSRTGLHRKRSRFRAGPHRRNAVPANCGMMRRPGGRPCRARRYRHRYRKRRGWTRTGLDPDADCDPDTDSGGALRAEEVGSLQGDEDVAAPIGNNPESRNFFDRGSHGFHGWTGLERMFPVGFRSHRAGVWRCKAKSLLIRAIGEIRGSNCQFKDNFGRATRTSPHRSRSGYV